MNISTFAQRAGISASGVRWCHDRWRRSIRTSARPDRGRGGRDPARDRCGPARRDRFSSFGVLVYYAIANAAAFTQSKEDRRWSRALNLIGLLGCLVLVATLPTAAIVAGSAMFAIGLAGRALVRGRRASG